MITFRYEIMAIQIVFLTILLYVNFSKILSPFPIICDGQF